jgi:sugar lactone lactonase YvrE
MKSSRVVLSFALSLFIVPLASVAQQAGDDYPPGPDSMAQPGVPKGEVLKFTLDQSKIFPGTYRDYWIYVPAQYKADKPTCLYDNLIYKKDMPVTIGVFVMHGRVRAANPDAALDRFNRSYEYDGLGDNYVRFLLEELLPDVETKKTSDGRPIKLSRKAEDRSIGGSSSGAICAFTAAWERPDSFSRVFSAIGTYVGLRGGDHYPALIRRFEPKPIRVFLQDGSSDLNIYGGDWWIANQTMERALIFAGYEVQHVWGTGAHSGKHGTALFPDAMRWLWKDWPQPVKTAVSGNATLKDILIPDQGWGLIGEGYLNAGGISANRKGEAVFTDIKNSNTFTVGVDSKPRLFISESKIGSGQSFGPDGRLYAVGAYDAKVIAYDGTGRAAAIADGVSGRDLVAASNGNVYVTTPDTSPSESKVWLIKPDGQKKVVDSGPGMFSGVTLSPDQTLLYVADSSSRWVYSYQIQQDGSLGFKQRYYWLEVPDSAGNSGAGGMCVDADGRLYVATLLGVQVCDQAGRVNCILPTPTGRPTSLCIGGENFDELYAACGDRVYVRKLKVKGSPAWGPPHKPAAPRL